MITSLSNNLPAGNIKLVEINGNEAIITNEPRGTYKETWFYWKFTADLDAPGTYTFRFVNCRAIGPRGACVSIDHGKTWTWNGIENANQENESFTFTCDAPMHDVQFCVSIPYLQENLDQFLESLPKDAVRIDTLTHTRHGRAVELITAGNPNATNAILLTTRHHCQEAMATFALEGIIDYVVKHQDQFENLTVMAVPFVDKDGALEGDQGKRRTPHDHARDYGERAIYPETRAIMNLVQQRKPTLIFDLHCPWLRGGWNEHIYMVGRQNKYLQQGIDRFSEILEQFSPPSMPYKKADNIAFGQAWNTAANYDEGNGMPIAFWGGTLPWKPYVLSMEIPFANVRERTITQDDARLFGNALARSITQFLQLT